MKYSVEQTNAGLRIDAAVSPGKQKQLIEEFTKCAAGTCSCPTPQYEKLQSIEVAAQAAGVTVNLHARPGEAIEIAAIERCLDHTARQIGD